jgi:arylsulfatase A-like enzyme
MIFAFLWLGALPTVAQDDPTPEATLSASDVDGVKPDIIAIMLDDLGYVPDDRVLKRLPNIERLFLREGKRFTQAYNEIPMCCPARANFHSGQHSLNNGIVVNTWFGFDNSQTLATAMDDAGYHTLFLGKYMNDYEGTTVPAGWDKAHIANGHIIDRPRFWKNGDLTAYDDRFFDDVTRGQAITWLKAAPSDEPVFELVSPYAPHRHRERCDGGSLKCTLTPAVMKRDENAAECRDIEPFKPPSYTTSKERDPYPTRVPPAWTDGWPLERTCESLLVIDRLIAGLEAAQAERGRPVYFVLFSDNGMSWGQHGFPLKFVPWSTRMPLYMSGPDVVRDATDAWVSIIDLPLTIAELGGATMPWADGESFVPVLKGEADAHRSELLEMQPPPPLDSGLRYRGWEAIRTGDRRYIRWDDGMQELYDIRTDPWELDDLSRQEPATVADLDARLDALLEESKG